MLLGNYLKTPYPSPYYEDVLNCGSFANVIIFRSAFMVLTNAIVLHTINLLDATGKYDA